MCDNCHSGGIMKNECTVHLPLMSTRKVTLGSESVGACRRSPGLIAGMLLALTLGNVSMASDPLIQYLTNPPQFRSVEFSVKSVGDAKADEIQEQLERLLPGSRITMHDVRFYLGAMQGEDYFMRTAQSLAELQQPLHRRTDRVFGRTSGTNWIMAPSLHITHSVGAQAEDARFAQAQEQILSGALNLGILLLYPGSRLVVSGSRWTAQAFDGELLSGEFFSDPEGRIDALAFRKGRDSATNHVLLEYGSNPRVPAFYPTRMTAFKGADKVTTAVIEIHTLQSGDTTLTSSEFMSKPQAALGANVEYWIARNGEFFRREPGRLVKVEKAPQGSRAMGRPLAAVRWIVFGFLSLSLVVMTFVIMRHKQQQKQQPK
jgi:hypothetical protein